ncbi:MAG: type II toxin-antitoxin system RelE/ParE family toxin [Longimicrobiales bacterium]
MFVSDARRVAYYEFVWLPSFERSAEGLLAEEDRRKLELLLIENPARGATVAGAGGVRKLRIAVPGRGKRFGARVIYYFRSSKARFYMIAVYGKAAKKDLTPGDKAAISKLVRDMETGA